MCDPLSIATAALSVGSAVVEHVGINQAHAAAAQAANLNYAQASDLNQQKAMQLDQEKSQTAEDTAITAARSQGAIANSAAEQGLGKATIASALHADMFGLGRNQSIADLNDTNARAQLSNEMRGASITRDTSIASAPKSSLLQLGLGVGKGVMQGVSAHNAYKKAGT